jgi:putative transposase
LSVKEKKNLIDINHPQLSVSRQCEIVGLSRSSFYYQSIKDDSYNEYLMRLIDKLYTDYPFYGVRRMTAWLRSQGESVNHKRISRLMNQMGIEAIYPKPRLSKSNQEHRKYPYLLKGLTIERPNQVWCTDITYIPMRKGFIYLVAIMDWFSRYVLSWSVSITLDVGFCLEALQKALNVTRPEIFNSDQGSQFTSNEFINCLKDRNIRISMDGRGRVFDNIFIERLWRTVKYEEVYLKEYLTVTEAIESLGKYFDFYNDERFHQSLGNMTPKHVHYKS